MLITSLETTYMNNNVNKKQQLKALKDKLVSKNINDYKNSGMSKLSYQKQLLTLRSRARGDWEGNNYETEKYPAAKMSDGSTRYTSELGLKVPPKSQWATIPYLIPKSEVDANPRKYKTNLI